MVSLPAGTTLIHERNTLFPCGVKSTFAYGWYSSKPFWSSVGGEEPMARYVYETKAAIPNLVAWPTSETKENELSALFKKMWPGYVLEFDETKGIPNDGYYSNDYAQAAFITQVLGYNGMVLINESGEIINCILGSACYDQLELKKLWTFNHPQPHPGYTSTSVIQGSNYNSDQKGITYYSPEEVAKIRAHIIAHPIA